MPTLSRDLRKLLERTVVEAREVAEEAGEKALEMLAVGEADAHRTMTAVQKALRSRLRAHGKQLGDSRNETKGTQDIDHLLSECAYEQWHRMLFTRFLAENQLLLEPESGVAVTIDEVKELAQERGRDWVDLSGEFAVRMLPQVFRQGDPVLEVQFAPEDRRKLDELLASLPANVFTASDGLGWTYQFWQTMRKDEVNASGEKIGADELPAVTQLFTDDYMVDFLLDNTLGAWHAGKALAANPKLAEVAQNEDELRHAVALPGCAWKYLRFIKREGGKWSPAAGTFDGWPKSAKELTCLDPCMGSGHFVVAMFERLVALRMAEEALADAAAVAAVICDNLYGLEIDPRCTQIGAFNLALAAWRRVGHCKLPAMNLACSGLAPNTRESDWLAIAGDSEKLRRGMARLYRLFEDAPLLGSLIDPRAREGDLLVATFHELQPLLEKALGQEVRDDTTHEMAVTARGLTKAAEILAGQFTLVATNVPYLGRRKQAAKLSDYCEKVHPDGKADLAACFVERCLAFCVKGATACLVTPQTLLFLTAYSRIRTTLLKQQSWNAVVKLGEHAFESPAAAGAFGAMLVLSRTHPTDGQSITGLDVSAPRGQRPIYADEKAEMLRGEQAAEIVLAKQKDQLNNPNARVILSGGTQQALLEKQALGLLSSHATILHGQNVGDNSTFNRFFWEVPTFGTIWRSYQLAPTEQTEFSGRSQIVRWEEENGMMARLAESVKHLNHKAQQWRSGKPNWGKQGVAVSLVGRIIGTLYDGDIYGVSCGVIIPNKKDVLGPIWEFVRSGEFETSLREVDPGLVVSVKTVLAVPFDIEAWTERYLKSYPNGLPKPSSNDPTHWLFDGHPSGADEPLHVAVARLLGYQWPRQTGSRFPDCPALGLDGLEKLADDDGIVCLSAIKGEAPAAERLHGLLARAYSDDWNATRQEAVLAQVSYGGASLEDWLRNGFFEQHSALFHERPFIWHIWDGLEEGFHALVNYHQLAAPNGGGHRTLEKLTFSYLGDWITRQKAEQKAGREGADDKIAAAIHLQNELKSILAGEPPYDLFVRWKSLHEQAIGWEPDINDGVRMNIRPFMAAETLKGKSIFRKAPKIKWEKDRGKEPERSKRDFPWFWNWDEGTEDFQGGRDFDGNRWNDVHYSNAVKAEARDRHKEKGR
jgi:hypothetical protein